MNERTLASSVPFRRETTRSRLFGPRKEGPSDRLTPVALRTHAAHDQHHASADCPRYFAKLTDAWCQLGIW